LKKREGTTRDITSREAEAFPDRCLVARAVRRFSLFEKRPGLTRNVAQELLTLRETRQ
jgi:hypothetical protein